MFLCVSGTSKKYLVHGPLIEAGILTSPLPHVFAQLGPVLGTGTLPAGVSTPAKWSRNVSMGIRNLQKMYLVHGAYNRSWDIDLPAPHVFAQCGLVFRCWHALPMGVFTHPKWYTNVPICLRNLPNKGGARGFNRSWNIDLPAPHVFAQLGLVTGHTHSAHRCVNTCQVV